MKKTLFFVKLLIVAVVFNANAQIDFEGLLNDYQNGANLNAGFHSNNYQFVNYYNETYYAWSGFAQSKMTDVTTAGYENQYSAITGEGNNQSDNYLVSYISSWDGADYIKLDTATTLNGFYVTNSTYAYLSMHDGDAVGKKFGGSSDDDPDFFILTVKGFNNGTYSDSVNFYLADYRDSDNSNDYIIDAWTFVDLSSLNTIDSLVFELSSSDNGAYGMNTPAYFCIDDLTDENNIITDLEEIDFDYYNGSDLANGFILKQEEIEETYFYNNYNEAWQSWTGFAYSRKTDVSTAGFSNQYSAITGEGNNASEIYAVANGSPYLKIKNEDIGINSIYITNSTYSYLSMQDGDAFAKQFGGISGDDPDWFLLTIKGYVNGIYIDSINFYLADYRFANNIDDYIINEWTEVDLTSINNSNGVDSITFALSSSDNGAYGMNTPAYFCLDDIDIYSFTSVETMAISYVNIYPNPVKNILNITNANNSNISIYNLSGKLVYTETLYQENTKINFSNYEQGVYIVSVRTDNEVRTYKIVKQ